jgi:hypothetical protein
MVITEFPGEIVVVPVNRCIRVMKMLTSFKKPGKKQPARFSNEKPVSRIFYPLF